MDTDKSEYWKPHVSISPALLVPKTSKAVAACKKKMFSLTHSSLKIFPNGTAFDDIFVDSPIFNRNIINGVSNMIRCKYSKTQFIPTKVILRKNM